MKSTELPLSLLLASLSGCASTAAPRPAPPLPVPVAQAEEAPVEKEGVEFCGSRWPVDVEQIQCRGEVHTLAPLAHFPRLRSLDLSEAPGASTIDLSPLATMPALQKGLQKLDLEATDLRHLDAIEGLHALRVLSLSEVRTESAKPMDQQLSLASFPNLEELDLERVFVPSLDAIATLEHLQVLNLRDALTAGSEFPKLKPLRKLRVLLVGDAPNEHEVIPASNLAFVKGMPLEHLDMGCRAFDGRFEDILAKVVTLHTLFLCEVQDFAPLAKLPNLTDLKVIAAATGDLRSLARMIALRRLHISENQGQTARLPNLEALDKLETLTLRYNKLEPLGALARLPALEDLTLGVAKGTDIAPLASLTKLRRLNLSGSKVVGVSSLGRIQTLEALEHRHSSLAPQELSALQQQRPQLIFDPPLPGDELDEAMRESH